MKTSQIHLDTLKPEYCEYSKPNDEIFICSLTQFGFVFCCLKSDKENCPDLAYIKEQKERKKR